MATERPQPFTEAQLEWITEQTQRACEKSAKMGAEHVQRRGVIGFVLLVFGLVAVQQIGNNTSSNERAAIVESGQVVSVAGCNRDYREDIRIRDVFLTSRGIVRARLKSGESVDVANDKRAVAFYDEQLKTFALPDCRKSAEILTSDPDKHVPRIEPFYEGSPNPDVPRSVFDKG